MMGEEGKYFDSSFSQLSEDTMNTKLEPSLFCDFIVIRTINDLLTFQPNEAKLSHQLNLLWNTKVEQGGQREMQKYIKELSGQIKEAHFANDCKVTVKLKCVAHPQSTSHLKEACWVWHKSPGSGGTQAPFQVFIKGKI